MRSWRSRSARVKAPKAPRSGRKPSQSGDAESSTRREGTPSSTVTKSRAGSESRTQGGTGRPGQQRKPWSADVFKFGVNKQKVGDCPGGKFRIVGNTILLPSGVRVPFQRDDATARQLTAEGKLYADRKVGANAWGGAGNNVIGVTTTNPRRLMLAEFYTPGELKRANPEYYLGKEGPGEALAALDQFGMGMGADTYVALPMAGTNDYCVLGGGGGGAEATGGAGPGAPATTGAGSARGGASL